MNKKQIRLLTKSVCLISEWGELGNIWQNGCGAIAAYNVLVSQGYQGTFNKVKTELLAKHSKFANVNDVWNWSGLAGIYPGSIVQFMKKRFKHVISVLWHRSYWNDVSDHSDAVITLFKWSGGIEAHYVAGIRRGKRYRFYNANLKGYYNGGRTTMKKYLMILDKMGCKRMGMIGVHSRKLPVYFK